MNENKDLITRGEAIKKMGCYAGLTALGTFMILSPKKAQAQSTPSDPGGWGGFSGGDSGSKSRSKWGKSKNK
jgi:hypothetical protein